MKFIVLNGPSASGKTVSGMELRKLAGFVEAISHTTRQPRVGENEGDPYYFVTKDEWDQLEKVEDTCYAGNYYCLSKNEMDAKLAGNAPLYVITDVHGLAALEKIYGKENVVSIYIQVPPYVIEGRMRARGDTEENIAARLKKAADDHEFDNWKYCKYTVDNSGALADTVQAILKIAKDEGVI